MEEQIIKIKKANQNNLKNINIDIPLNKFIVVTGVSGAGKSSLVLDTIYSESQRRFFLSLSTFARQFFERIPPPDVEEIEGLQPSIAIIRKGLIKNPRSTVATITEIYDFLRILYTKIATLYCPSCNRKIIKHSEETLKNHVLKTFKGKRIITGFITEEDMKKIYRGGFVYGLLKGEKVSIFKLKNHPYTVVVDDILVNKKSSERIYEDFKTSFEWGKKIFIKDKDTIYYYSNKYACAYCDINFKKPEPNLFSFNSSRGACPECKGFGDVIDIDEDKVIPDKTKSIKEGAIEPYTKPAARGLQKELLKFCKKNDINTDVPYEELRENERKMIFEGTGDYYGVKGFFGWLKTKKYKTHVRVYLSKYRKYVTCPVCNGGRLNREALSYRLENKSIAELNRMNIKIFSNFIKKIIPKYKNNKAIKTVLLELQERVKYLLDVGLNYLTLNRKTFTLSGGEAQRISLTSVLGSTLSDTMIIIDEPSKGLHLSDFSTLINTVKKLNNSGNTIIMIEHLEKALEESDLILELGPGAGDNGGKIVFEGNFDKYKNSKTYKKTKKLFLSKDIKSNSKKFKYMILKGAKKFNLQDIDVKIPLNSLVCITGVSGAGKSTLLKEVLYKGLKEKEKNYKQIINSKGLVPEYIDDSPPSRSSKANVGTYLKILDDIRQFMATLPESKSKGFKSSHFSHNTKKGQCPDCKGKGYITVEMQFLSDLNLECERCRGRLFKDEVLDVKYKGKNIYDIFNLTLSEAEEFFRIEIPKLSKKIDIANGLGLEYLTLGQTFDKLSGGESQRIKLAKFFKSSGLKKKLFLIDEPTTGLHPLNIKALLKSMKKLIDKKASIIAVEHNPIFIKSSDYVVDLGPGGGDEGGEVVFQGIISDFMNYEKSITSRTVKNYK